MSSKTYTQLRNKSQARKLHAQGVQLYCLPSNANPLCTWWYPPIPFPAERDFDAAYNEAVFYNCNNETGRYLKFYTED